VNAAKFPAMPLLERSPPSSQETSTGTLGDVLYARPRKLVPETEWVALVQRVAVRDQRALHALYERTHRMVFTLAVRITGNRETAEEVTLDVFHEAWRRAATYDAANGTVIGWIMNQARSRAIDRLRLEQRKKRVNDQPDDILPALQQHDPHDTFERKEAGNVLRTALDALTPEEKQVIETAFFSGLTYAEVAAKLDQPLGTVKTRIRSGLGKLRKLLAGDIQP
jgi:RNA polymerase sigma-70 factor (ECF subfamily)